MNASDRDGEKLREAYLAAGDVAARGAGCPGDEAIWAASRGESPPDAAREILAHAQHCPACSRSLAMAAALAREAGLDAGLDADVHPFPARRWRALVPAAAMAAAVLLALALVIFLRPGAGPAPAISLEARVQTVLWRVAPDTDQPLGDGSGLPAGGPAVAPGPISLASGDRLYLTVDSDSFLHVYVINTDAAGRSSALFPVAGAQWSNPLPPGRHRLPGEPAWRYDSWEVTSADGPEAFQIIASLEPLPGLEAALAGVDAAAGEVIRGGQAGAGTSSPGATSPDTNGGTAPGDVPPLASVLAGLKAAGRDDLVVRQIVVPGTSSPAP